MELRAYDRNMEHGVFARFFISSKDTIKHEWPYSEQVALVFMELYSELGDNIALQYGGSEAHKKVSGSSGPGKQVRGQFNDVYIVRI